MQLDPYVTQVQSQLAAAAALGDETTRVVAETLATAAEPAVRLALLSAISAAADEITSALLDSPGTPAVAVRLDGDDLRVEVRVPDPGNAPADTRPSLENDEENNARISLRLPETLKAQIDGAARADGVSVNTWIVRAASSALAGPGWAGRRGSGGTSGSRWAPGPTPRLTGWING